MGDEYTYQSGRWQKARKIKIQEIIELFETSQTVSDGFGSVWAAKCEKCGGEIVVVRPGDARCMECDGAEFDPPLECDLLSDEEVRQIEPATPTTAYRESAWRCRTCGKDNEPDIETCIRCGSNKAEIKFPFPKDNSGFNRWFMK